MILKISWRENILVISANIFYDVSYHHEFFLKWRHMFGGLSKYPEHVCKVHRKCLEAFEKEVSPQKVTFCQAQNEVRIFWENVLFEMSFFSSKVVENFRMNLQPFSIYLNGPVRLSSFVTSVNKSWPHDMAMKVKNGI